MRSSPEKTRAYNKRYYAEHKRERSVRNRAYYEEHREEILTRVKGYEKDHHEKRKNYQSNYRKAHRAELADYNKFWGENHKEEKRFLSREYNESHREERLAYVKRRKTTNIQFKIATGLRVRLSAAIKNDQKKGSAVRDLGIPITGFRLYLEGLFQPGMAWNNWGRFNRQKPTWNIDHKIPLSSFDLTNRQEFQRAVHYSNLQPMWAEENLRKGNRAQGQGEISCP